MHDRTTWSEIDRACSIGVQLSVGHSVVPRGQQTSVGFAMNRVFGVWARLRLVILLLVFCAGSIGCATLGDAACAVGASGGQDELAREIRMQRCHARRANRRSAERRDEQQRELALAQRQEQQRAADAAELQRLRMLTVNHDSPTLGATLNEVYDTCLRQGGEVSGLSSMHPSERYACNVNRPRFRFMATLFTATLTTGRTTQVQSLYRMVTASQMQNRLRAYGPWTEGAVVDGFRSWWTTVGTSQVGMYGIPNGLIMVERHAPRPPASPTQPSHRAVQYNSL